MKKSIRANLTSRVLPPTWQNLCTITFSLLTATPAAHAVDATWSATPANALWSNTDNWSASPVPGLGDTATFGASTVTTINTGDISLTQIATTSTTAYTFGTSAGTGSITFADGTTTALNITNPGPGNTTANITINANIILGTAVASNTTFTSGVNKTTTLAGSITGGTGGTAEAKTLTLAPTSNASSVVTVSGAISDGGATSLALSKGGTGTVNLTNANNSFTGGLSVLSGTVNVSSLGALGSATTGLITLGTGNQSPGTLNFTGSPGSLSRQVQIGSGGGTGGATINNNANNGSSPLIFTNALFNAQTNNGASGPRFLTLGGSNTDANEIQGVIRNNTGSGAAVAVTKADAGTWTLSGGTTGNTYTGATQVNGGILVFGKTAAKASGTVTAAAAGSIGLGVGGTGYYSAINVGDLFNTSLTGFSLDSASGVAIDTTAGDFDQNVALTAARSLTKLGSNTLTLSQTNSYTGATQVNGGILVFGKTAAKAGGNVTAAAAGSVGLGVGGTGFYSATNVGDLFNTTLTGFTLNSASGVAIDTKAGDFDQNVALTAARSLTKLGSNTLTLSQSNSYTGITTVSAGTLVINGNQGAATGAVSVTGKLSGSGTVGGATTINSTGIHNAGNPAAGNGVGSQTFLSTLNYTNGSIFEWDLNANSTEMGFDTVVATGGVTVGTTGTIFKVLLGTVAAAGIADDTNLFWNTPYGTQTWTMASIFGSDFTSGAFQSVLTSTDVSARGSFSITGSSLTWTAVPEPTSALAGMLITAGLLRRRRPEQNVSRA